MQKNRAVVKIRNKSNFQNGRKPSRRVQTGLKHSLPRPYAETKYGLYRVPDRTENGPSFFAGDREAFQRFRVTSFSAGKSRLKDREYASNRVLNC